MALFIAGLAFRVGILQTEAKLAILVASVVAGSIGYAVLKSAKPVPVDASAADAV